MMVHVFVIVVAARLATPIFVPETAMALCVPADPQPSCWNENPPPPSSPPPSGPGATMAGGGRLLEQAIPTPARAVAALSPRRAGSLDMAVPGIRRSAGGPLSLPLHGVFRRPLSPGRPLTWYPMIVAFHCGIPQLPDAQLTRSAPLAHRCATMRKPLAQPCAREASHGCPRASTEVHRPVFRAIPPRPSAIRPPARQVLKKPNEPLSPPQRRHKEKPR